MHSRIQLCHRRHHAPAMCHPLAAITATAAAATAFAAMTTCCACFNPSGMCLNPTQTCCIMSDHHGGLKLCFHGVMTWSCNKECIFPAMDGEACRKQPCAIPHPNDHEFPQLEPCLLQNTLQLQQGRLHSCSFVSKAAPSISHHLGYHASGVRTAHGPGCSMQVREVMLGPAPPITA